MKNAVVQLSMVLIGVTGVHAVKILQTSSLHTRILPAEGAEEVWAIQGNDSVRLINNDGDYYLSAVNPGPWRVTVDAKKPYKNVNFEIPDMRPGTDKDLGEIRLHKETLYQ